MAKSADSETEHLRERAEELSTILQSIGDAVVVTDAEGRVTLLNPVAEALMGYTRAEALGRPLTEVFHIVNEHTRAPVDDPVGEVLEHGLVVGLANHTVLIAKGGEERPIADSAAPVRSDGRTRGVVLVFRDHTEERAAEQALRESESRFRLLVERTRDYAIFMLDPEGRVKSWNVGAERLKGFSAQEILGEHFSRFYPPEDRAAGKPARLLAIAEAEGQVEDEGYRVRKDGTAFWADVVITAIRDEDGRLRGFGKVTRDLTERRLADARAQKIAAEQAARAESERAARYLADASAVLASSLDGDAALDGLARLLVPSLADWCAIDLAGDGGIRLAAVAHAVPAKVELAHELRRRSPPTLDDPTGVGEVLRTGEARLYAEITPELLARARPDPEVRAVLAGLGLRSATLAPLVAHGRTIGVMTLVVAESDRRYDEADLALARDLGLRAGLAVDNARLYAEARRAVALRDDFLSIAGHELKTPLTAFELQLQSVHRLLARPGFDLARLHERLAKLEGSASRFATLVDQLLDVSRITAMRIALDMRPTSLAALAREAIDRFAEEAARAGCALRLVEGGELRVRCDPARIDQVLTNLLGNAVKYGAGKPVELSVRAQDGRVVILVKDQGIGIAKEHQRRIFDRFERAVSAESYGGFGLGLWIAREIVEAHGGTIRVESAPGRGSTFRVELPAGREDSVT